MSDHPKVKGLHITVDKRVTEKVYGSLSDFQRDVEGNIEPVMLVDGSTMYVDEEFRYKHTGGEGFNSIATDLAGLNSRPDLLLIGIGGPVVVVGPLDDEGYDTDITEKVIRQVNLVGREAGAQFDNPTEVS